MLIIGSSGVCVSGALITWLTPYPASVFSWTTISLGGIYCAGTLRLPARSVLRQIWLLMPLYLAAIGFSNGIGMMPVQSVGEVPFTWLVGWLIVVSLFFMLLIAIQLEHGSREFFLSMKHLIEARYLAEMEKARVQALHVELEKSTAEAAAAAQTLIDLQTSLRQKAVSENHEKTQFIASAVHDLKQPVHAISTVLKPLRDQVRRQNPDQSSQTEALMEVVEQSAQFMRDQLNAISDLSRLELGQTAVRLEAVGVSALIDSALAHIGWSAQESRVAVHAPAASEISGLAVKTDRLLALRMLLNLAQNSIKYRRLDTAEQPSLWIGVSVQPEGCVCITLRDNGQGMSQLLIDRGDIFKPFFQANNFLPEAQKGVGLGLTIVRAIEALLPGHRVVLTSEPGVGTVARLYLPQSEPSPDVREASVPKPFREDFLLPGMFVLLIEDDLLVADATRELLHSVGARVLFFSSHAEFMDRLNDVERVPDLLITDHRLPGGFTSHDVISASNTAFGYVPTLVVTGETLSPADVARLQGYKVLRKPLDPEQLIREILSLAQSGGPWPSDLA